MFQSLINKAQHSVDAVVSKYVMRAVVAVPFVIALGFGTAAASIKLTELYGALNAYSIVAAAYASVGLLAAIGTAFSGARGAAPSPTAAAVENSTAETVSAADEFDPGAIISLLATTAPVALPGLLRALFRNFPLVLGLLVVAFIMMYKNDQAPVRDAASPTN